MKIYTKNCPGILSNQFDFTHNIYDNDIKLAFNYEDYFTNDAQIYLKLFNIPVIGGERLDKIQQYLVLSQSGINTPTTYFNKKEYRPFRNINEFDSFCELDSFVVKPISGARGLGVKLIDRKQFKKMIEDPHKTVDVVFEKELELQKEINSDIEEDYVRHQFSSYNIIVQNEIKVKREFRMICFPTDSIIYERKKEPGQFLGNLSHGSTPIPIEESVINEIDKDIIIKIRKIMDRFNYPWLSVDLYIDEDNKVGVFEFQMEFAYEGFKPKVVRDKMEEAIYKMLSKFEK